MLCSDWCRVAYNSAIDSGNTKGAQDYIELYNLWLVREAEQNADTVSAQTSLEMSSGN